MVERWLREIQNLPSVKGSFIATMRGAVLESHGLEIETQDMQNLAIRLLRIHALTWEAENPLSEIELYWKDLFIVGKISQNVLLVTICDSPQVVALLRITINVSLSHIVQEKKIYKKAKSHVTDPSHLLRKGQLDENETRLLAKK